MPFRYHPTGAALSAQRQLLARTAAWSSHRSFHASSRLRLEADTSSTNTANHYETLNVRPDASPAEIKKSFYHLSKRHHPDHNPSDPHAPTRFMHISEAYATLSHADKRARYDRDVMRHAPHTSARNNPHYNHHPAHKGSSFHSTGPAGGRPASGLSRRRGTYQGPPPSFYRSGGWGAHGAKRRAAHEESTGTGAGFGTDSHSHHQGRESGAGYHPPPPPPPPPGSGAGGGGGFGTGGMGPGQDPFGHRDDVPHFDREAHMRAQKRSDDRRAHKIARDRGVNIDQPETSTNVSFIGMAAILVCIVMGPFVLSNLSRRGNGNGNGNGGGSSNGDKARERERERERKAR